MPNADPAALSPAEELGWHLARTREERGVTIEQAAVAIHLRKHYVQALEAGRFYMLPGATYARGYLKRYADFLELNALTILAMYDKLEPVPPRKFFTLSDTLERNPNPSARLVVMCVVMIGILLLFWGAVRQADDVVLVEPFAPFEKRVQVSALPHRCEGLQTVYPPCYWEDLRLWYHPTQVGHYLFIVDKRS